MDVYKKIRELVEMMQEFDLMEVEVKDGEREIRIRKGREEPPPAAYGPPVAYAAAAAPQNPGAAAPPSEAGPETSAAKDPDLVEFKSPMVGTFYRAPSPESPPYVTEGDRVNKDTVLCIIEAMKVMNEIKAEMNGEIVEILVENGEAVEFGQPLFLIRTSR